MLVTLLEMAAMTLLTVPALRFIFRDPYRASFELPLAPTPIAFDVPTITFDHRGLS